MQEAEHIQKSLTVDKKLKGHEVQRYERFWKSFTIIFTSQEQEQDQDQDQDQVQDQDQDQDHVQDQDQV